LAAASRVAPFDTPLRSWLSPQARALGSGRVRPSRSVGGTAGATGARRSYLSVGGGQPCCGGPVRRGPAGRHPLSARWGSARTRRALGRGAGLPRGSHHVPAFGGFVPRGLRPGHAAGLLRSDGARSTCGMPPGQPALRGGARDGLALGTGTQSLRWLAMGAVRRGRHIVRPRARKGGGAAQLLARRDADLRGRSVRASHGLLRRGGGGLRKLLPRSLRLGRPAPRASPGVAGTEADSLVTFLHPAGI
jgi:hypothetical protein